MSSTIFCEIFMLRVVRPPPTLPPNPPSSTHKTTQNKLNDYTVTAWTAYSDFFDPKAEWNPIATAPAPPMMFPIVTGIMFLMNMSAMVISAPLSMPSGSKNMLATLCSNPMDTNAEMGKKIATIFPGKLDAPLAI